MFLAGDLNYTVVFIRVPKTASTSLYDLFGERNFLNRNQNTLKYNLFNSKKYSKVFDPTHASISELFSIFGWRTITNFPTIAVVRNPWDWAWSCYCFGQKNNFFEIILGRKVTSFLEYLTLIDNLRSKFSSDRYIVEYNQYDFLSYRDDIKVDNIIRFENLHKEFDKLSKNLNIGIDSSQIPHLNENPHDDYREIYDQQLIDLVAKIYHKDIKHFKYDF